MAAGNPPTPPTRNNPPLCPTKLMHMLLSTFSTMLALPAPPLLSVPDVCLWDDPQQQLQPQLTFCTTCVQSSLVCFGMYYNSLRELLGRLMSGWPLSVSWAFLLSSSYRSFLILCMQESQCYVDWTVDICILIVFERH